uniref:Solute carrier family 13 member 5 n=1 Tax=Meleagris gallopavo TaxID=9103 RepID=A0A803XQI9_MELGA
MCLRGLGNVLFLWNTSRVVIVFVLLQAASVKIHPLYVMLPGTLSASFAFMLPVATPPNAIVFSYGHIRVLDMVRSGIVMNIIGVFCVTLAINTWGRPIFELDTFPTWANSTTNQSSVKCFLLGVAHQIKYGPLITVMLETNVLFNYTTLRMVCLDHKYDQVIHCIFKQDQDLEFI